MTAAIAMVRKQKLSQRDREGKKDISKEKEKLHESIEICIKVNKISPKQQNVDKVAQPRVVKQMNKPKDVS